MNAHTSALIASGTVAALVLAGCGSADDAENDSAGSNGDATLHVAAAFYPFEYVATEVGGEHVSVVRLTPPGVESHDVELSPATVRELGTADIALYLSDFQPAVDDAIATAGIESLDAAGIIELHDAEGHADEDAHAHEGEGDDHAEEDAHADEEHADEEHADEQHAEEDAHADEEHADEQHADEQHAEEDAHADEHEGDDHDHGSADPHFWLDPILLAEYGDAVADAFAAADPAHADEYAANAQALHSELEDLDAAYADGLAQCERDTIIVSHEAFGYLADAYGLHQEGMAGLDPENEPSPARLLEIQEIIEETGATTIFAEDEVSQDVAEALADDAGAQTAVLDPGDSLAEGDDYIGVMNRNLDALTIALGCG